MDFFIQWWREFLYAIRKLNRRAAERDLDEEINLHVEMETHLNIADGMSPDQARQAALLTFGGMTKTKERTMYMWRLTSIETLWRDIRHGLRLMVKNPGFTAVAVLSLALGIGANTAIFSIIDAVLLKPLPYVDPDRLMTVSERPPGFPRNTISPATFLDWRDQNKVFEQMSATAGVNLNLTGGDRPEQIQGANVTANYFDLLGVNAAVGRTFAKGDDEPGKPLIAVLTNRLWQRRFGGQTSIVGTAITLNDAQYTVIGVLPANSSFDRGASQIFLPMYLGPNNITRKNHFLVAQARLKPGVTKEQAQSNMDAIASGIAERFPTTNKGWGVTLDMMNDVRITATVKQSMLILFGAVGLVLLIACGNLANLTLAKVSARQKEISTCVALGASRIRIIRQFLTESLVLAITGGVLGILSGYWMLKALRLLIPPSTIPAAADIRMDYRVLLFTIGLSVMTGLIFGLAPALQASKVDISESLKSGGRNSSAQASRKLLSHLLVISEIALSLVLLVGSFLLIRSLSQLQHSDLGFQTDNLLTLPVTLPNSKYKTDWQVTDFYTQAIQKVKALPGVDTVGLATDLPIVGWSFGVQFEVTGRPAVDNAHRPFAHSQSVNPDYFRALSIPIVKGRAFTDQDRATDPAVAIINQTIARNFFPNEDPIGKHLTVADDTAPTREIVGVVADVKIYGPSSEFNNRSNFEFFAPYAQVPFPLTYIAIKTNVPPMRLAETVQREFLSLDKDQPITSVRTMDEIISESLSNETFNTSLLSVFAAIAILLSAIGIYGILSYTVTQQTREIGIRIALGAQHSEVLKLVVGHGMKLVGIGVVTGLAAAFALTRTMSGLLYKVSAIDPLTYAATPVAIVFIALVACYLPARRATKVEPIIALRFE